MQRTETTPDRDIERLKKLLAQRKHTKMAELLVGSRSNLNDTGRFGSLWSSTISHFEIISPVQQHERLTHLSDPEKRELLSCIHMIYPLRPGEPEVVSIEFLPVLDDLDRSNAAKLVQPEKLATVDYEYIQDQLRKCREKVDNGDHDGAVTNARTLIETTCLYILEASGIAYKYNGKLSPLYGETSKMLGMDASQLDDDKLKKIISGAVNIVDGMAGLRNAYSDAHGIAPGKRFKLDKRHTVLVVNLAKSISEFLYSSWRDRTA